MFPVTHPNEPSIPSIDGIRLDRSRGDALYLQLAQAIRERIAAGALSPGTKLPSTREAAESLGVNRATVVEAYRWLRDEGWVRSGVGAGTFVLGGGGGDPARQGDADRFWSGWVAASPRPVRPTTHPDAPVDLIRLTSPTADPAAFPLDDFREVINAILAREGAACLDYGPPDGYGPLRALIAERLRAQGVEVDPGRVVLVNGSQQGLELIFRLVNARGGTLLVEEPTYQLAIRTARSLRVKSRGVPMDASGLRVDRLESILDEVGDGFLYTMPVFQNPTGVCLSEERRARLLALSAERSLPILEDHFDAELDYRGDAPRPLLAEGSPHQVMLLGTFSKILFPGLRVGWLVVPEPLLGSLSEMKVCADLSGGLLTQMALYEFCRQGLLDAHLARIRARNGRRLDAMLDALEKEMPAGSTWTRPTGGMTLWVRLPGGLDSDRISDEAMRRGVAVNAGSLFHLDGGGRDGLRLCFVREDEDRIRQGIRILSETVQEELARVPSRDREGAAAPIL